MGAVLGRRRYLTNFEPHRVPHLFSDVVVIGAGLAGLRAALEVAEDCEVLLLSKDAAALSSSQWAQGGIAAALTPPDSPSQHAADTAAVACGLGSGGRIDSIVSDAPRQIEQLVAWGARFDRGPAGLAHGREGGHSASRVLHADGDATGRELVRVLLERARGNPRIRLFEGCFTIDLLTVDGEVRGVVTHHAKYGHQMFWARATILASGGAARVYRESTNPPVATGDGMAMAFRAGARLRDLEMMQFHPTTLYVAGAARALISEAVRGEGALLVDRAGRRFMPDYDPRAELASRDIVSRAIANEMRRSSTACVYLDARHFGSGRFAERFPSLHRLCRDFDIDPQKDLIPVRPAAHYSVGGVATDAQGQTSLPGLYAAGEVASSGLHGANRLASNSLLECLVMGQRCGAAAAMRARQMGRASHPPALSHLMPQSPRTELDLPDVLHSLQSIMSRNVAVERSGDRLRETLEIIEFWSRYVLDKVLDTPVGWETQNLLTLAACISTAALTRTETRGVHYRTDHPATDDAHWRCHLDLQRGEEGVQVATAPIED